MRNEDRARWTKLVADYESADLSQREFAQERGISLSGARQGSCRQSSSCSAIQRLWVEEHLADGAPVSR